MEGALCTLLYNQERNRMLHSSSRQWWIGLLGLIWLGMTNEGQAQVKNCKVKVNFNIEVNTTPTGPRPTAPWYAYFPADPRIMPSPQLSPFPPFPMPFPPPPQVAPKKAESATAPTGPALTQYWPTYQNYSPGLQAVGYVPYQAPSYWYQGR
jgi:hypothetical protein